VTNDLHYAGSIHSYMGRRKHGMDVRIVKARDWVIDLKDLEAAIGNKTLLVAITLLSNVNGHIRKTPGHQPDGACPQRPRVRGHYPGRRGWYPWT
jgi:hypothetical protein